MAIYRVIKGFYDLQDPEGRSFHLYNKGDEYPRKGLDPSPERIAFLMSDSTRLLEPVIEEVPETAQDVPEKTRQETEGESDATAPESSEKPAVQQEEQKPKRRRKRGE